MIYKYTRDVRYRKVIGTEPVVGMSLRVTRYWTGMGRVWRGYMCAIDTGWMAHRCGMDTVCTGFTRYLRYIQTIHALYTRDVGSFLDFQPAGPITALMNYHNHHHHP